MSDKSFIVYLERPASLPLYAIETRRVIICAQSSGEAMALAVQQFPDWKPFAAKHEIIRYD